MIKCRSLSRPVLHHGLSSFPILALEQGKNESDPFMFVCYLCGVVGDKYGYECMLNIHVHTHLKYNNSCFMKVEYPLK